MIEILITSSVLILALLLLRGVFRKALSRRVQYALWGLVLLRLLIPFQLPAANFSVLTSVQPVQTAVTQELERRPAPVLPSAALLADGEEHQPAVFHSTGTDVPVLPADSVPDTEAAPARMVSAAELLAAVRWAGTVLAAVFFLLANLNFRIQLSRRRTPFSVKNCRLPVYLVEEGLSSPCLFGLFRPAIYLTPGAVSAPQRLSHVLAHEKTHARHLDPLWALLRCVCLALYWFDPLVWIAAAVSKADCELACDESVLARLGEEERISYGQTLLSLIPVKRVPASPLLTATTMAAGKKQLKDRITRIARKPRQFAAAAAAAAILAGMVSACTFTGASQPEQSPDPSDAQPPAQSAELDLVLGDPIGVLSLADVQPYTPEPFTLEPKLEWDEQVELYREGDVYDIYLLTSYEEQMQYFAVMDKRLGHVEYRCFLALPLGNLIGGGGSDGGLFGWDGPVDAIDYYREDGVRVCDYVCIAEDGTPVRLAQAAGTGEETFHVDCDGDGTAEVVSPVQLFFQREDVVYLADLTALWSEAFPEYYWNWGRWDPATGLMKATGYLVGADEVFRSWTRCLRFDGENLLVYNDPRTCVDHVMSDITVPEGVIGEAKQLVWEWMPQAGDVLGAGPGPENGPLLSTADYDDWRIEGLTGPTEMQIGGITLHAYCLNYEYHTTTPTEVLLVGGMYITEDDWVMPSYPYCEYLFFQAAGDGELTFLWHEMSNDAGPEQLAESGLRRLGLLQADPSYQVQELWDTITKEEGPVLRLTTADGVSGPEYGAPPYYGNMPWDITRDFRWEALETVQPAQLEGTSVLTVSRSNKQFLSFYQEPRLVEYQNGEEHLWFRAEQAVTDDIFACELFEYVRQWYDEIEANVMGKDIVIPDDGRSRGEIARAWVEQYEGVHLNVTSGSKFKCTYLAVPSVELDTTIDRQYYPGSIGDQEAFLVWYSVIFVPENDMALNWMMAGNTGECEGEDAPEGAFQYWRCSYLYLDGDGWRCDSVGTGP